MIKLTVPTSFAQMKPWQLRFFVKLMLAGLPVDDIKVRCFLEFSGLHLLKKSPVQINGLAHYIFMKKGHGQFPLDVDRFADMLTRLDYLAETPDLFAPPPKLARSKACNMHLYGIRLDQYLVVDNLYIAYSQTQKTALLNQMLAVFYTRKGDSWDDGNHIARRAKRFRFTPLHQKWIVYHWFTAVKKWLIDKYPYVFPEGSNSLGSPADEIVMGFIAALNEGRVADNTVIKGTEVHEALYELNRKIEFSKSIKSK